MANSNERIGIDLGGTKIAAIVLADGDKVLFEDRVATPKGDYRGVIAAICDLAGAARAVCRDKATVGIGIPGSQSPQTGTIQNANSTWMNGQDFQLDISKALGQQVKIANDANCLALSEAHDGTGRDAHVVFGVIIGTGCGGGLVIDKKPVVGRHAITGEWGHTPLPWPDDSEIPAPECWCGLKGCLELWVSGSGLERDFRLKSGMDCKAHEIASMAENGDAICQAAVERHANRLARGLAMITNIIDPDVIVLGGGLSNMDHLYRQLPGLMKPYIFADHFKANVCRAVHGDASGVRGAARLWDE